MKKFLFVIILISAAATAYALCPVNYNGENICTTSGYGANIQLQFPGTNNNLIPNQKEFQPKTTDNFSVKENNLKMQYDSSCQFENCIQDTNNTNNKSQ